MRGKTETHWMQRPENAAKRRRMLAKGWRTRQARKKAKEAAAAAAASAQTPTTTRARRNGTPRKRAITRQAGVPIVLTSAQAALVIHRLLKEMA